MARKVDKNLMDKLTKGNYNTLLSYIQNDFKKEPKDRKLRLEIIPHQEAINYDNKIGILYRMGRILEISSDEPLSIGENWKELPDTGYKETIEAESAENDPKCYFDKMIPHMDKRLEELGIIHTKTQKAKKPIIKNQELDAQQNIASCNSDKHSEYIIIDTEYQWQKYDVGEGEWCRPDKKQPPKFDLLGIKKTGEVVLFELKKGTGNLTGDQGIGDHIKNFEYFFRKELKEKFKKILEKDIKDIIELKETLGVLEFPKDISINIDEIKFMFIFDPKKEPEKEKKTYINTFINEVGEKGLKDYQTIFVSSDDYKLKPPVENS